MGSYSKARGVGVAVSDGVVVSARGAVGVTVGRARGVFVAGGGCALREPKHPLTSRPATTNKSGIVYRGVKRKDHLGVIQ
jgi:hypothetical protein